MSNTFPSLRPDGVSFLQDHEQRIRELEANPNRIGKFEILVFGDTQALAVGDAPLTMTIPRDLDGTSLRDVQTFVTTASSSGLPTVQIRNVTTTVDMLSTKVSIDVGELDSLTAATPFVIDAPNAVVAQGDRISPDVDIAGTDTTGLIVVLVFY